MGAEVGGLYRHFKGHLYRVAAVGQHTETGEPMVIYRDAAGEGTTWVRPESMWDETVTRGATTLKRFEPVAEPIGVVPVPADCPDCLDLRREVFIGEQGVSEADEIDGRDGACDHFLIYYDGRPVGTFRCFREDGETEHLGRLCVKKAYRLRGCGRAALDFAAAYYGARGIRRIVLGAQCTAIGFYESCGFSVTSGEFLDAGIRHRMMARDLNG